MLSWYCAISYSYVHPLNEKWSSLGILVITARPLLEEIFIAPGNTDYEGAYTIGPPVLLVFEERTHCTYSGSLKSIYRWCFRLKVRLVEILNFIDFNSMLVGLWRATSCIKQLWYVYSPWDIGIRGPVCRLYCKVLFRCPALQREMPKFSFTFTGRCNLVCMCVCNNSV